MKRVIAIATASIIGFSLLAASVPQSSSSEGINLVSATSVAKGLTLISLSSVYQDSEESNSIDLISTKIKGLLISIR